MERPAHDGDDPTSAPPAPAVLRVSVVNAMDGMQYDVDLSSRATGNVLRQELLVATGIPTDEQILLYGPPYTRLDPKKTIESYQFHTSQKAVFVYDRRTLSQETLAIAPTVLQPQHYEVPSLSPSSAPAARPLYESSSPLLKALYDYEVQFKAVAMMGQTLDTVAQARLDACDTCLAQQRAQASAIQAAMANLDTFHIAMTQHFQPFWKDFRSTSEHHEELLTHLEAYIGRLETIPLHPALQTPPHRTTLYDCIPLERVRDWRTQCEQSHTHLQAKMEALAAAYHALTESIRVGLTSSTQSARPAPDLLRQRDVLYAKVVSSTDHMNVKSIVATLQTNYETVVQRVAETVPQNVLPEATATSSSSMTTSYMFASATVLEAFRGLDEMQRDQAALLPHIHQVVDDELKTFMLAVAESKDSMSAAVHTQLRWVSRVQSEIRDFEQTLSLLKDALAVQKRQFAELNHVAKLPEAYDACLQEIVRRRSYGREFTWKIQSMGEKLAQMREDEVLLRDAFLKEFGQHLPRDFVPGLVEKPSHCDIRMRPFDTALPAIDAPSPAPFEMEQRELDVLRNRCKELEGRVDELQTELDDQKKASCHCSSFSNASSMSCSAEKGPNFPLVLALAATAGHPAGMANSSELLDKTARLEGMLDERNTMVASLEARIASQDEALLRVNDECEGAKNDLAHAQFLLGSQRSALKQIWNLVGMDEATLEMQTVDGLQKGLDAFEDMWLAKQQQLHVSTTAAPSDKAIASDDIVSKIAFRSFSYDDLALFLPTFAPSDAGAAKIYLAFHLGCPNRFLSDESIAMFHQAQNRYPEYILGRIVFIDEREATERDNPYRLILGTTFYVLTVTCLVDY
ncbi:hypothetical protein, variant [Saprolegnia diclina VS20]|uniref:Uncharacterized protein n=1 Tax=Saprolegnia diclina (strain VS20) TaxID=1156394 RepID=T0RW88_SAPDV|nr:hypothetical protein, variant [Saprolegnia diclina VS20]EQC34587.1 hypothetical protein, variant [Saprolegnia diclina VS20]|eukprot:XP_008611993.1 hypothetical protein, variant [Saprolegnia diclina VS20]